jgi:hypothetical protein
MNAKVNAALKSRSKDKSKICPNANVASVEGLKYLFIALNFNVRGRKFNKTLNTKVNK